MNGRSRLVRTSILLILAALAGAPALQAQPRLYSQETAHFRVVYYNPNHEYLAPLLIRSLENSLRFYTRMFGYEPKQQITVLIQDFEDYGYGSAGSVPDNNIQIGMEPFNLIFDTLPAVERISLLSSHELGHIVVGDQTSASNRVFRRIFQGKILPSTDDPISIGFSFLASPRQYSPRWFHEGTATFLETWLGGGFGRALGGYDEMVFRSLVRDESYIYEVIGLESEGTAADFQVGANSYLYGTRFMNYLAKEYSPDKFVSWIVRKEDSRAYFESEFQRVYGVSLRDAWRHWIVAERQWQQDNLATIRKYPVTRTEPVSNKALGSASKCLYDPQTKLIYLAVRHPGRLGYLAAVHPDSGKIDPLTEVEGSALYYVASLTVDPAGRRIFFTTENNDFRGISAYHLDTHKTETLASEQRAGELAFNAKDQSLWAVRHTGGLSGIVRFEPPYREAKTVHIFPFATDLSELEISPDGEFLTGLLVDETAKVRLVRFPTASLLAKNAEYEVLYDFGYDTPGGFVQSADGRYFYGSSYGTGVSNLFRVDVASHKLEALSNSETGLFRPLPLADGNLLALEYTSKGFLLVTLPLKVLEDVNAVSYLGQSVVQKYPQLKTWKLPSRSEINDLDLRTSAGEYKPLARMKLTSAYPIVQKYKDAAAGGIKFNFSDPLTLSNLAITAAFSPDASLPLKERFHASVDANYWDWSLAGYFNKADFYDLFGPTKVSRRGFGLKFERRTTLNSNSQGQLELKFTLAGFSGLDRLPDYQNIVASHTRYVSGTVKLSSTQLAKTLGAIEDEQGSDWSVNARLNYTGPQRFPSIWGGYDRGFLMPLRNSSLWIRSSAGRAFGPENDTFANFYFGAFGNNWIDKSRPVPASVPTDFSRYRGFFSFPGEPINAIGGRDFAKTMVEWDSPPWRFRSAGWTAMYFNWVRMALFSGVLGTNLGNSNTRAVCGDAGAQLDFRLVWFTYMKSTLSVGFAATRDQHGRTGTEKMISLKLY